MLALAHALETHKTLSGEDVTAVFEGGHGPLVDGTGYADDAFIARLREYHLAAKRAHQDHNQPKLQMPTATPAYVVTIPESYVNGNGSNGNGSVTGNDEVMEFGPLGAPTYDPPTYEPPSYDPPGNGSSGGNPPPDDEH